MSIYRRHISAWDRIDHESRIDSRDVLEAMKDLQDERDDLTSTVDDNARRWRSSYVDHDDNPDVETVAALLDACIQSAKELVDWDDDYADDLKAVTSFNEEGEATFGSEWQHGVALIRDDAFEDYAEELASEVSDYDPRNAKWPFTCIDWAKAARDLQTDYSSIEWQGDTYWGQS